MNRAVMFSKATDEWRTPQELFEALDAEFGFDVDVAATFANSWKENYFGPDHLNPLRRDALALKWHKFGSTFWMNPPYSKGRAFIEKAAHESCFGATVVCLMPSRTDTRWWHQCVWDEAQHRTRPGVELRFLRGRLKFIGATAGAPFPSVLVIFRGSHE